MIKILNIFILLCISINVYSLEVTGQWTGEFQEMRIRLVFNVSHTETGYVATMDSPDQGVKGIPVSSVEFENDVLTMKIPEIGAFYTGILKNGLIEGEFSQQGMNFTMNLTRDKIEKLVIRRPQEPIKPYPYYEEEVRFVNPKANIKLAGTLTLPAKKGKFPVVVLITGSGLQNRDEELMGHKPFLIIADYLTRNGIGVLRFDDRGGGESEGSELVQNSTTMDFVTDVESAVSYLKSRKDIDYKNIGLIGHSEGGIIAPIVATQSKDVSFIILMAGTGLSGSEILLMQQELISSASGVSDELFKKNKQFNKGAIEIIMNTKDTKEATQKVTAYLKENTFLINDVITALGISEENFIDMSIKQLTSPWMQYFIKFDPKTALIKVKCPVLVINGEKDLQVPPKENLRAIQQTLHKGGNQKVTIKEFPGLNHLFQECETGLPNEYVTIEQTISPDVLKYMLEWIKCQVNLN